MSKLFIIFFFLLSEVFSSERQVVWDLVVKLVEEEDHGDRSPNQAAVWISDSNKNLLVSQEFSRKLLSLDSFGRVKRTDHAHRGHAPTVHLGKLYFKSDTVLPPLDPGMEMATYLFHSLLFGEGGLAPSCFIFVKNLQINRFEDTKQPSLDLIKAIGEGREEEMNAVNPHLLVIQEIEKHLVQVSLGIEGELGKHFIENVEKGQYSLEEVDVLNFQEHFITSLFLLPGDHKCENFIVVKKDQKQFVFIDNDKQLYFASQKTTTENGFFQEFGGCKNILFLLTPLMEKPLHEQLVKRLLSINPEDFLRNWLEMLTTMNCQIETIFQKNRDFFERYTNNYLPFKLYKGTIQTFYKNFILLQKHLSADKINCAELFRLLHPDIESYYQQIQVAYPSYLQALKALYSHERPLTHGREIDERLHGIALRGRWLFNALDHLKKSRLATLEESIQELSLSHDVAIEPIIYKENWTSILLKNITDPVIKDFVCQIMANDFLQNSLPHDFVAKYPYSSLASLIQHYLHNGGDIEICKIFLNQFTHQQQVYEDFVFRLEPLSH